MAESSRKSLSIGLKVIFSSAWANSDCPVDWGRTVLLWPKTNRMNCLSYENVTTLNVLEWPTTPIGSFKLFHDENTNCDSIGTDYSLFVYHESRKVFAAYWYSLYHWYDYETNEELVDMSVLYGNECDENNLFANENSYVEIYIK